MFERSTRNQYLTILLLNFSSLNSGLVIGWPSSTFPSLQANETPLPCGPFTLDELSPVISIFFLGGLMGTLLFGAIVDYIGRRKTMILASIPQIVSWLLILFAQNIYYLLVARFCAGLGCGGTMTSFTIYVSEFADPRIRGKLESFTYLISYVGTNIAFALGNNFSYHIYSTIYVLVPTAFLISVLCLPETPSFLIRTNKIKQAKESLAFFRSMTTNSFDLSDYYNKKLDSLMKHSNMKEGEASNNHKQRVEWRDFVTPNARQALLIGIGLVCLNQLSGGVVIINYVSTILENQGSFLNASQSSLIISAAQLLGALLSIILIEKVGRKPLLAFSSLGAATGLTVMGIYMYLKTSDYDMEKYSVLLICSLAFFTFVLPLGLAILPTVILFEIMPEKIRGVGCSTCVSLIGILSYITTNYYYALTQIIGTHGCMFIFAGFCFTGAICVIVFLKETKGKSLQEIQRMLLE